MIDDSTGSGTMVDAFEGINDRFTSLEMLGVHGHNVLARAQRFGSWYMLKGLAPAEAEQGAYRQMLVKEFEVMHRINHPGVAQVHGIEDVEGLGKCIVMEWVEGVTLKQWLDEGRHSPDERRNVATQLMDALAYIHRCGVVHRDIKPSNIMVTKTGMTVKIIDFGLADTDAHTTLKQPAGTVRYMAPEQATASQPDVRNDIYSLGMVLKQMDLGGLYRRPIARCLLPIDERYPSVDELQADLRHRATRRRIDATNAATHLREHLDTLSRGDYVWVDWNHLSREGRIIAMPRYMLEIRSRFTSKELSEIEYALTEHCTHYEVTIQQRIHAKKVFTSYYENSLIEGE